MKQLVVRTLRNVRRSIVDVKDSTTLLSSIDSLFTSFLFSTGTEYLVPGTVLLRLRTVRYLVLCILNFPGQLSS